MRKHRVITTAALLALALPATAQRGLAAERLRRTWTGQSGDPRRDGHWRCFRRLQWRLIQRRRIRLRLWDGILDKWRNEHPTLALKSGRGATHTSGKAKTPNGQSSGSSAGAYQAASTLSGNETASVGTRPSVSPVPTSLYIVLAFAALRLTAAITDRLVTRGRDRKASQLKGCDAGPE